MQLLQNCEITFNHYNCLVHSIWMLVEIVPNTKGGTLTRKLREIEDELSSVTGFRIKFKEAGGRQLQNLFNTDLGAGIHCGRTLCPPCDMNGDKRGTCRSRNMLYESRCLICNPEDRGKSSERKIRKCIYIGESSRSIQERSLEHVRDAESFSHKSHIVKHWLRHHRDLMEPPPFTFSITTMFKDFLSRQIGEALQIQPWHDPEQQVQVFTKLHH